MADLAERLLNAVNRLLKRGGLIYDAPRGDDTPIPTCVGCGTSDWLLERIRHHPNCAVEELVAAVREIQRQLPAD